MLVLTRKAQEVIRIGENITLTVLRIHGNTVRVGIAAPREVRVVRGELKPLSNDDSSRDEVAVFETSLEELAEMVPQAAAPRAVAGSNPTTKSDPRRRPPRRSARTTMDGDASTKATPLHWIRQRRMNSL